MTREEINQRYATRVRLEKAKKNWWRNQLEEIKKRERRYEEWRKSNSTIKADGV